jgi:NAD(P)-dependent dehydrogenase (short-subunit alcohol dehydrogenase family)
VTGRAVLVTGGALGIGRAISLAFAELGDQVAVHYGSSGEAAAELLATLPGSGHASVQADMRSAEEVRAAVDDAAARLGRLDVLVNNAGIFVHHPPTSTSYEDWQAVWTDTLGTNLVGAANATFCAVPHLIAAGGGAIVNVSSRGAFRGEPKSPTRDQRRHGRAGICADRDGPVGAHRARGR